MSPAQEIPEMEMDMCCEVAAAPPQRLRKAKQQPGCVVPGVSLVSERPEEPQVSIPKRFMGGKRSTLKCHDSRCHPAILYTNSDR